METAAIQLKDNRNLSYAESGKSNGEPVFIFHGLPGSRFLPEDDLAAAARAGVRIIVPERPGFGMSDFQPERTLLDWPDDVTALADHLGIDKFGVVGLSAGGPYAIVCSYKIPQRLTRAVVVAGKAPYNAFGEPSEIPTLEEAQNYATDLSRRIQDNPDEFYEEMVAATAESGRESLTSPTVRDWLLKTCTETFRNGTLGMVHELILLHTRPWGFPLEAITAPVHIWHGDADTNVPLVEGQFLAEHIPNCQLHILPGKGHFVPGLLEEVLKTFVV